MPIVRSANINFRLNPSSPGPLYLRDSNLVITVVAHALVFNDVKQLAGTLLTTKLDTFSRTFRWQSWFLIVIRSIYCIFQISAEISRNFTALWMLTHWSRVTHICVGKLTIIGTDNGLSPGRRQAIIWTSAGILLIGPFGTNFSEILIGIQTFSFGKIHLKMSSAKWRPFVSASMC